MMVSLIFTSYND